MTAVLKYDAVSSQPEMVGTFHGLSVAQIVAQVLPGASPEQIARTRVLLAHREGLVVVPAEVWARVYPHNGTRVLIRPAPGAEAAAAWLSTALINAFGVSAGSFAATAIQIGATLATTGLLVAAMGMLMPKPQQPGEQKRRNSYAATGWRNEAPGEDQAIPVPMGTIRVAPFYAMFPYNHVVGDDLYISAMFCLGIGPLNISDLRFGDASVDDYLDVQIETRSGLPEDEPFTLIRKSYVPDDDASGSELQQPEAPLDPQGEPVEGAPREEQPQVYGIASRAIGVRVIFAWRSGLFYQSSSGDTGETIVSIRIDQRRRGTEVWTEVATLEYRNDQRNGFFRQYEWDLPDRERWDVRITNLTTGASGRRRQNTTHIHALYSIRPEYPIVADVPLALVAINAKSQSQLDGTIDSFNALVSRPVQSWDGWEWSEAVSDNPADLYRYALQSGIHPYPLEDGALNLDDIEEFAEFCTAQGLTFNGDVREQVSFGELLSTICAAGRGAPHHDGAQWGVLVDRPAGAVDHIAPVNSWGFEADLEWSEFPHAVWFEFQNAASDYEPETVYILWPGHTGPVTLTEQWEVPGKTDRTEAMREVYRRMLEAIFRRERLYAMQEGPVRAARRGDTVLLSQPILRETQASGRIRSVRDDLVVLTGPVAMVEGETYVLRTVEHDDVEDGPVSTSATCTVMTVPGETRTLAVVSGAVPKEGSLFIFGPVGEEGFRCRVIDIEPAEDMAVRVTLTLAAEEIDALVEAWDPEEWSPISGVILPEIDVSAAPVFWGIRTTVPDGSYGLDIRTVEVSARADRGETVTVRRIDVEHRLAGAGTWEAVSIPGPSGTVDLHYDQGQQIELRLVAYGVSDAASPYSDVVELTVGSDIAPPASTPDLSSIVATPGLGHVAFRIATLNDGTLVAFRTAIGVAFDTATDEVARREIRAGQTIDLVDGDSTRVSLLPSLGGGWSTGGGWSIASKTATHAAGSSSTLSYSLLIAPGPYPESQIEPGQVYRGGITVSERTSGSVTIRLAVGTEVATAPILENGQTYFSLEAESPNQRFEILASADFDGTVSGVSLYPESRASAPQGDHEYRFAVLNEDDLGSAVSEPITTTII